MNYNLSSDGVLTISIEGRIDTINSPVIEKEINEILSKEKHTSLVFNLNNVSFVSSAGLRIFLRLKQANTNLSIINVKPEVYEIFEMTGFTEIMSVSKAYREFSIEGCEIIGKGAIGTVYRVSDDTIVKVFRPDTSLNEIKHEIEISHKAFILGIPTAISYDVVKVGDCYGTVYELLNCDTLKGAIAKHLDELDKYTTMYSNVLHALHKSKVNKDELPSIKEQDINNALAIKDLLPKEVGEKLIRMLEEIPDDLNVCHGDCHIKNIMLQNDEPFFIDMDTLSYGNLIFDFARMYNTYYGYTILLDQQKDMFIGLPYETVVELWKLTLSKYFKTTDTKRINELTNKFAVVGNAYLFNKASLDKKFHEEVGETRYQRLKNMLIDEINSVDNLLI